MTTKLLLSAATIAALATGAGVAVAQDTAAPTTVSISAAKQVKAPAVAPFDAPGVRAIRRGKPLPAGYVLVGRDVSITIGKERAYGAARFTCPAGKRLRTAGRTGQVAPQMVDLDYVGKTTTRVLLDASRGAGTHSGTVYAVCR